MADGNEDARADDLPGPAYEGFEGLELACPAERSGHVAVGDGRHMFVWGGYKVSGRRPGGGGGCWRPPGCRHAAAARGARAPHAPPARPKHPLPHAAPVLPPCTPVLLLLPRCTPPTPAIERYSERAGWAAGAAGFIEKRGGGARGGDAMSPALCPWG